LAVLTGVATRPPLPLVTPSVARAVAASASSRSVRIKADSVASEAAPVPVK
jgi:hypothetical protein